MRHSSSRTTPEQVARLYAGIARAQDPDAIVATALRTKSRHAREVLAELAWPGHVPTDIHAWAQAGPAEMPSDMDAPWLGRFAQVVALQEIEDHAFSLGRAVFEQIDATGRLADLPPHLVELFLQLRLATRDRRATESLLAHPGVREPQRHAIAADLLNPHIFDAPESEAEWLEAFNRALGNPSIADVCLRPDTDGNERTTFDRLSATSMPTIDSGRLITVLMSCFRPGPELFTAIRSVCQQTWSNWELLLIDDASGASYAPVFDEAAAMDNRIRVIRKALNGGTYRARNTGLRQARGEFCTVVDADDWIHPQAFERHVAPLIERAGLPGTISRAVKVNQHLELNRPGTAARVASAASLMFRTVPVVSRIGFFDPTGKGADTEFRKRIELVFGRRVREIPDVLSVLRAGDTLSGAEISRGWKHPSRRAYRLTYEAWHESIERGAEAAYLDPDEPRRFPEPRRWSKPTSPLLAPPSQIDVCVAGDLLTNEGGQVALPVVRAAMSHHLTVAVTHLDDPRSMRRRASALIDPWKQLVASGAVEWIQADDRVEVQHLYVPDPGLLQYPPTLRRSLRVSRVFLDRGPGSQGADHYCEHQVLQRAGELFGSTPVWLGQPVDQTLATLAAATKPPRDTVAPHLEDALVSIAASTDRARPAHCLDLAGSLQLTAMTCHVPLRSLADAESHDDLCIVFRAGAQQDLTRWLRQLADASVPDSQAAALFDTAPETVAVILLKREGVVQLLSRLPTHVERSARPEGLTTTPHAPQGWDTVGWLTSRPHRVLVTGPPRSPS